jgi:hypothetical protein
VAQHDLTLGRLAEDAHVRDPAMGDEVTRPGRVTAELGSLRLPELRLLDLAADRGDHDVSAQADAFIGKRAQRLDVAGKCAFHVRDSKPVQAVVAHERLRLESRHVREPRLVARVRRVHVPVEHQRRPAADPAEGPHDVRASLLDLLPLHRETELVECLGHELRHRLLAPREARDRDCAARPLDQPLAVDVGHARTCGSTCSPKSLICS